MRNPIAPELISHDFPWLVTMATQQPLEESLGCSTIPFGLKIHINNLLILIYCTPQIVLIAIDLHKDLVDEEGVTVATVLSFQAASV